jgi:hypothetical protein
MRLYYAIFLAQSENLTKHEIIITVIFAVIQRFSTDNSQPVPIYAILRYGKYHRSPPLLWIIRVSMIQTEMTQIMLQDKLHNFTIFASNL